MSKPNLSNVTLVCADTTPKSALGYRAIRKSMEQCDFGAVRFFTHEGCLPHSVKIPKLKDWSDYSRFITREAFNHVPTSHMLVVQWDGMVVDGGRWRDEFLACDYLGPFLGDHGGQPVYNGGFSLRSRKLNDAIARLDIRFQEGHPQEDMAICITRRAELESLGCRIGDRNLARQFGVDGSSVHAAAWNGEFGFHSYCTILPPFFESPMIFHHSGDAGDVMYALSVMKEMGGGDIFLSVDSQYPTRMSMTQEHAANILPLIKAQDYVWGAHWSRTRPHSTHVDFNVFREAYKPESRTWYDNTENIARLTARPFRVNLDPAAPWLTVPFKTVFKDRPIIVGWTPRYHNDHFPWPHLIKAYGDLMVFVGTPSEHDRFRELAYGVGKVVPRAETGNLLDVAAVIAGGSVFVGNQSCPMAIALGLGKNLLQECWPANPNCVFPRSNAIYWGVTTTDPKVEIPQEWLNLNR